MKKINLLFIIGAMIISSSAFAQRTTDIDGGKDYPLVSRFEGSIIEFYKVTKWDAYLLPISIGDKTNFHWKNPIKLEGKVIRSQYSTTPDNNPAYVVKNFETAFNKAGYNVLMVKSIQDLYRFDANYYGSDSQFFLERFGFAYNPSTEGDKAFIVAKTNNGQNDIYIAIFISGFNNTTLITQDIVEVEAAATGMVTATSIKDGIALGGRVALDGIFFDTGVSTIKAESDEALKNIAEYLKAKTDSKFFIVGHTDNTGSFETNMKLSEERAKAVINELTTKYGIKPEQVKAYGLASLSPVTSNSTEKGKEKNRRVEIVEQ